MATMTNSSKTSRAFSFLGWDAESDAVLLTRFNAHLSDFTKRGLHKWTDTPAAFKRWWTWHGPTGFYSTSDALTYKRKLYAFIVGKLQDVQEESHE